MTQGKLGRIKGVNSDYRYESGKIIEVDPEHAELRIFLCPDRMPSHVEEPLPDSEPGWCEGRSESCPGETKKGHALLQLHQNEGIGLVTDGARVQVHQGDVAIDGPLRVRGHFVVETADGLELRLESRAEGLALVGPGGALVSLDPSGTISLSPAAGSRVEIHGDLAVKGDVIADGTFVPSGAEPTGPTRGGST